DGPVDGECGVFARPPPAEFQIGAGFIIGWIICGLFWLRVRLQLARAERKIKRLEQQIAPAEPVPANATAPAVKD
ncbi:DUF1049 domain-containing protein, partial [Leptospira borgpetersenii serovar Ballum]|nr:DUF1049 domain-containing protein [Leptospira borgpetersenii serovar Ballum]